MIGGYVPCTLAKTDGKTEYQCYKYHADDEDDNKGNIPFEAAVSSIRWHDAVK